MTMCRTIPIETEVKWNRTSYYVLCPKKKERKPDIICRKCKYLRIMLETCIKCEFSEDLI